MILAEPLPTFRDPAGSLTLEPGQVVRRIHPSFREATLAFLDSSFCRRLQGRGDLITAIADDTPAGLRLLHPRLPMATYPWEWPPCQWQAAATLTLNLCEEGLSEGWILKDATPLNILFVGPKPLLVDILSFERRVPGSSTWLAYGQYVRTFLLPLIMHELRGWPLAATILRRDGYEPSELYGHLGWGQRLSRAAFWPITLPTWLERNGADGRASSGRGDVVANPEATKALVRKLADLRRRTELAAGSRRSSAWSGYREAATHYSAEERDKKADWVRVVLGELRPQRTLDVGANTGEYSVMAASAGGEVIALERDVASADRLFRLSRDGGFAIQTICADLARPTPAVGWENRESSALIARLEGTCDLVMMLAVIHHFILLEQIPVAAILGLCVRLTRRYLIVEWVPPSDAMYRSLMIGREELYGTLSELDLLAACEGRFEVLRRCALGNGRILFLFEKVGQG